MTIDFDQRHLPAEMKLQMDWVEKCLQDGSVEQWRPTIVPIYFTAADPELQRAVFVLDVPFNEHHEKLAAIETVTQKLVNVGDSTPAVVGVVLTSEAWLSSTSGAARRCEPRHDPDRSEVIICTGLLMRQSVCGLARLPVSRRDGFIQPASFSGIQFEGAQSHLLVEFFRSYARQVGQKHPDVLSDVVSRN